MNQAIRTVCLAAVLGLPWTVVAVAEAADWPHWRGPNRNDVVAEDSGWDRGGWPLARPDWSANVGAGSTSPVVAAGRLYALGWQDGRDTLHCLHAATGREFWKIAYRCGRFGRHAAGDQGLYAGPTSSPEFDPQTGRLYTLSIDGDLNCWDTTAEGRKLWGRNLYDDFGMQQRAKIGRSPIRDYGYTTAPLVHGNTLVVEVGSTQGNLMGFDKRSGRRLWASHSKDQAGHSGGPVPITVQGVPCVTVLTLRNLLVVRLDAGREGQTVAEYPWATEFANNIASPAVHEDCILVTSGYNQQAICKLRITLRGATRVWQQPHYSKVCTPIIHDGRVLWAWHKLVCLDFQTGRLLWTAPFDTSDAGSCILAGDGRLIAWTKRGDLRLVELPRSSGGQPRQLAHATVPCRDDVWPHVVLAGGWIYCKDRWGALHGYRLAAGRRDALGP